MGFSGEEGSQKSIQEISVDTEEKPEEVKEGGVDLKEKIAAAAFTSKGKGSAYRPQFRIKSQHSQKSHGSQCSNSQRTHSQYSGDEGSKKLS